MIKATAAQAKRLGAQRSGWGGFKHNLMRFLGIPESEFDRWNVPEEWKAAFCQANGRKLNKPKI